MADIFITYAREDEARVMDLLPALAEKGWSVFWDRRIPAGETWRTYIGNALESARCILVLWSQHSTKSEWVAEEADEGKRRGILVPVLLDPVQPPAGFREIQAADLTCWRLGHPSQRFDELMTDLARRLGPGSEPPGEKASRDQTVFTPRGRVGRKRVSARTIALIAAAGVFLALVFIIPQLRPHPRPRTVPGAATTTGPGIPPGRSGRTGRVADAAWFVIAGSFQESDRASAERQLGMLARAGFEATTIVTDTYPLLRPGLLAVAVGPFASKEQADAYLSRVARVVPGAYVKQAR